jgi:DNA-binding XRE family transcriptional regulator
MASTIDTVTPDPLAQFREIPLSARVRRHLEAIEADLANLEFAPALLTCDPSDANTATYHYAMCTKARLEHDRARILRNHERAAISPAGVIIRALKARFGLTNTDLATRSGISRATIGHYESGSTIPTPAIMSRLTGACGTTVEELYEQEN